MGISGVGSTGSPPVDVRQRTAAPAESKPETSIAPDEAGTGKPAKPLDQVADGLKTVVLQTQETANDPGAVSNETLTQLFRTLVDLLSKPPAPNTKLDV